MSKPCSWVSVTGDSGKTNSEFKVKNTVYSGGWWWTLVNPALRRRWRTEGEASVGYVDQDLPLPVFGTFVDRNTCDLRRVSVLRFDI